MNVDAVTLQFVLGSFSVFCMLDVAKESLSVDKSKNCQFWKQSDKIAYNANFTPIQKSTKAWIEAVADISALGGLRRDGNDDAIMLLSFRNKTGGSLQHLTLSNLLLALVFQESSFQNGIL